MRLHDRPINHLVLATFRRVRVVGCPHVRVENRVRSRSDRRVLLRFDLRRLQLIQMSCRLAAYVEPFCILIYTLLDIFIRFCWGVGPRNLVWLNHVDGPLIAALLGRLQIVVVRIRSLRILLRLVK